MMTHDFRAHLLLRNDANARDEVRIQKLAQRNDLKTELLLQYHDTAPMGDCLTKLRTGKD